MTPSADIHDADAQDYAGTSRPDAIVPALDKDQLAALGEVGRQWDRTSAGSRAWRQALPVDPALGAYPTVSEFRPARFTRLVPVAGRDGQLPPIQTTRVSETPPTPAARAGQEVRRLRPALTLTVIVPEIVTRHWWHHMLYDHVAGRLRRALRNLPGVVVTSAPFHLTH